MPIGTGPDERCTSKGGAFLFLFFISPDRFDRISSKHDAIHGHRNALRRMLESCGCSKSTIEISETIRRPPIKSLPLESSLFLAAVRWQTTIRCCNGFVRSLYFLRISIRKDISSSANVDAVKWPTTVDTIVHFIPLYLIAVSIIKSRQRIDHIRSSPITIFAIVSSKRFSMGDKTYNGVARNYDRAGASQRPSETRTTAAEPGIYSRSCWFVHARVRAQGARESYNFEIDGYPRRINPRGRTYRARVSAPSAK